MCRRTEQISRCGIGRSGEENSTKLRKIERKKKMP